MKYKFPKGFWWGAASSGPQMEGSFDKSNDSVMDYWHKEDPKAFFNEVGPEVTTDFYHHYQDDIKLFEEIGFNSFRTSIQWTRLIKDIEKGTVDEKAVAYYNNLFDCLKEHHIEVIVNLSHFDMPIYLQNKYNGWESRHTVELFVKYAKTAFELFKDKVKYWTVMNEPMVVPEAGYLYGLHYPCLKNEGKRALQVMYNMALTTSKVVKVFREVNIKDGKIGTILNLTPAYPRSNSKEDIEASEFVDDFFNNMFVMPALKGEFPQRIVDIARKDNVLWESDEEDASIIKNNTVDFLGVNYYHPKRVKARETLYSGDKWMPDKYFEDYDWPDKRINPYRGWEIYPQAIYDIMMNMKNNYPDIPFYISENGMGVEDETRFMDENGFINDDYRIEFYEEHLAYVHKGISEGAKCFGFHAWTAIDNWSWNNAYKNRYGYISLDLKTQKRTIKKSGYWLKEVSKNNGF